MKQTAMMSALLEAVAAKPELAGLLAAMAQPKKGKKAKAEDLTDEQKAARKVERMAANDAECIKVFTAAGFKDVRPRVNVLTYGKVKEDGTKTGWLDQGRKVKKGEKSHRVGNFNLFHIDQTENIDA